MSGEPPDRPERLSPQAIHLLRTSMLANLALSRMADQKASLLMGATFVVFTLAVGQASGGYTSPALVLLGTFAFLSACFAVAAVVPRVGEAPVGDSESNLLFFGVFTDLPQEEFADRVLARLTKDEDIYRMMLRDIYQNGQVLQRKKYRLLGWSYRIFFFGLSAAMVLFLIEQRGVFARLL